MNIANRARIARKRVQRLGLQLCERGVVFTLRDEKDITMAVGPLAVWTPFGRNASDGQAALPRGGVASVTAACNRMPIRRISRCPLAVGGLGNGE